MSQKSAKAARKSAAAPRLQSYSLRPARGQALLNFQGRLTPKNIPVFDADIIEKVNTAKTVAAKNANSQWRDQLIQGDCLSACAYMRRNNIAVDLVYIDPPFASGANYAKNILLRRADNKKSAVQNDQASLGEEVLYNDIWQKEDYLNWIYERLLAIREIMSENASIYVHLDWHIGHYVKILMDEVFGEGNFRNEVVWHYRRWTAPGLGYQNMHDTILFYGKGEDLTFNKVEVDPTESKKKAIKKGFHTNVVKGPGGSRVRQLLVYDQDKVNVKIRKGELDCSKYDRIVSVDADKVVAPDVWTDINFINSQANESTGYATQKPQDLVERIIKASSNEGDLVADFFCGSGTTAKAAHTLGRRFIGCDVGINAIQTSRDGLRDAGASFDIWKIRDGVRLFRNPAQTKARVFSLIPGWESREKLGLGGFWDGGIVGKNGAFTPVKFVGIEELLTEQVLAVVLDAAAELGGSGRDMEQATILYVHKAEDVDQRSANQAARRHQHSDISIRLMSLDELLAERGGEFYTPDCADVSREKIAGGWRVRLECFFSPYLKEKLKSHNKRLLDKGNKGILKVGKRGLELVESVQFDVRSAAKASRGQAEWNSARELEDSPKKGMVLGEYEVKAEDFRMKIRSVAGDELIVSLENMTVLPSGRKDPKAKAPKAKAPKAKAPKAKKRGKTR